MTLSCNEQTIVFSKKLHLYILSAWSSYFPLMCGTFWYSLRFKIKLTLGHKLCYKIKVTFGDISLKLCQTNWNFARTNVSVVVDELPSQITFYTCLIIDIWTQRRRRTSTRFYALWCHPPKASFQWNWYHKFLTWLWTPLACRKALSESYATHAISC